MEIVVDNLKTKLIGKVRVVDSEAPAVRVKDIKGREFVVGMMAPVNQIILTLPTIDSETSKSQILKLKNLSLNPKKFSISILVENLDKFNRDLEDENIKFYLDNRLEFAKKYGLLIEDRSYKIANAIFLIDKEGVIKFLDISKNIFEEVDFQTLLKRVKDILSEKKRGHSHENWMRA